MNINISKSINKLLKKDEVNINIEVSENCEEIENIIKHINVEDILYFYSDGNYNYCKTINKVYRVKSKLYDIDKKSNDFLRISKSCIVNINQVKSFDIGENRNIIVRFYDGSEQFVARRKIKEVMNYLDERMI